MWSWGVVLDRSMVCYWSMVGDWAVVGNRTMVGNWVWVGGWCGVLYCQCGRKQQKGENLGTT